MSYQSVVLSDSPLYYNRGGTSDIGSLGHTGTIHGTVTTGQAGLLPNGDAQTSDLFDGSTGYITASDTGLPTGANPVSLEFWINPVAVGGGKSVFDYGTGSGSNWIGFSYSGSQLQVSDWVGSSFAKGAALSTGHIYYFLATMDGSHITLYLGDVTGNTLTTYGPNTASYNITLPGSLYIGGDSAGDETHAYIQERAIYGSALSSARATAHWNAGLSSKLRISDGGYGGVFS